MVKIVADTTCGLPQAMLQQRGVPLIPQVVIFGEESYHDDGELDTAGFLKKLKEFPTLPKTSAPEPALYHPIFAEAAEKGEAVVVVAPTSKASGTVRSAQIAAQDFPGVDIRVVDTLTVSCNLGSLVLLAHEMACAGSSADEIVNRLNEMIPRSRLYFMVDTLEYLARGGRIGGAKKLMAELLEIKPILQMKDGQVEPFEQQRTRRRAVARLVEVAAEQCREVAVPRLCVLQVQAEQDAQALVEELKSRLPVWHIPIYQLPPAIVVHAGPRAMGVGFFV
ncbi:MAG: DegV family protein [Bacteroidota bacterium]